MPQIRSNIPDMEEQNNFKTGRRNFLKVLSAGGTGLLASRVFPLSAESLTADDVKPGTNVADAMKHPRTEASMPGRFPAKVVQVINEKAIVEGVIQQDKTAKMLEAAMLNLTGAATLAEAWRYFVSEKDIIGLKVNPVAGKELSTSLEVTRAIIDQLVAAGIPKKNIVIFDRREFELTDAGFTAENFPGIRITGTECKDAEGGFYDKAGKLYSEERIDKNWYYWADTEEKYDAETIPYMINEGKYSYFSKLVTTELDKIINIPILKNAGSSVTLALKNLAYGVISNTGRLHKQLWSETCAEVCAFPPVRDKVVLNIVDGLKGCFNGGPGANPQYFCNYNTLLVASDPVAVDRAGYEIVLQKRLAEGVQKQESEKGRKFMALAHDLQLGENDIEKIDWKKIELT